MLSATGSSQISREQLDKGSPNFTALSTRLPPHNSDTVWHKITTNGRMSSQIFKLNAAEFHLALPIGELIVLDVLDEYVCKISTRSDENSEKWSNISIKSRLVNSPTGNCVDIYLHWCFKHSNQYTAKPNNTRANAMTRATNPLFAKVGQKKSLKTPIRRRETLLLMK